MGALREADIKTLLCLAGEVSELPRQGDLRLTHLLERLVKLLGGRIAAWARLAYSPTMSVSRLRTLDRGWTTPHERQGFANYLQARLDDNPIMTPVVDFLRSNWGVKPLITSWRRHFSPEAWQRHPFVQEVLRPNRLGEALYIVRSIPCTNHTVGIAIMREWGDTTPFNGREFKLSELLHESLGHLLEEDAAPRISPRAQQVLERMIAGDSAKEVAARLKLSIHTINEHVHAIYRAYGVSSRGELMSLFIAGAQTGRLLGSSPR